MNDDRWYERPTAPPASKPPSLHRWSDAPVYTPIAQEGGVVYERCGSEVYLSMHGGLRRYYCRLSGWECSHAARRIRGEFGKAHPKAERLDDLDW